MGGTAAAQPAADALERRFLDQSRDSIVNTGYIHAGFDFHVNSNSVTNNFKNNFLYGGYISNEQKDQVSKRLRNVNVAGLDVRTGITGKSLLKNRTAVVAGLFYVEHYDAKFTKDFFELVFRGNSRYAGQTIDIAPLRVRSFTSQQLYLGFEKKSSEKLFVGGGVNIIRGGRFSSIELTRGKLHTEQYGTYVELDGNPDIQYTDRNQGRFSGNGYGASLTLYGTYRLEKSLISAELRDLGFISWRNLNSFKGDGVYRYEGQYVEDIFSIDSTVFEKFEPDSVANQLGIQNVRSNKSYLLPATLHLNYQHFFNSELSMTVGIRQIFNASYRPRVYLRPEYYLSESLIIAATFSYGGYGRGDFEISAAKKISDFFIISANIFYFEQLILPRKSSGHGFGLNIVKTF